MRVVMVQRSDSGRFPWRSYEPRYTSRSIIGAVRYIAIAIIIIIYNYIYILFLYLFFY